MKVRFKRNYVTQAREEDRERFSEGEVVDLAEASAQHFINRGVAEEVKGGGKARAREEARPAPKPPPEEEAEPAPKKEDKGGKGK